LPLFFQSVTVWLPSEKVQPFLETFFPTNTTTTTDMGKVICFIGIDMTSDHAHSSSPVSDMKWLLAFLLDHPNVQPHFDGDDTFDWESEDLFNLLYIAMSAPAAWRGWLERFDSINLSTKTSGSKRTRTRHSDRPSWVLEFVLKPEEGKGAKEVVEDMGLRSADGWSNERSHRRTDFGVLCVEVIGRDRAKSWNGWRLVEFHDSGPTRRR
jgi:hypothetical protein